MMTGKATFLTITLLAAALTGCGKSNKFSVDATIDGVGTQNLKAVWPTSPDGLLSVQEITAVGNSFKFSGHTAEPTLVEIYTAQGTELMRFMVDGGDEVRLRGKASDPRVNGSETGVRFAEAMGRIGENSDRNAAVAEWVAAHPADPVAAGVLLSAFSPRGHEAIADSLMAMIDSTAAPQWLVGDWVQSLRHRFPKSDTIAEFRAFVTRPDSYAIVGGRHIYVITETELQRTPSLVDSMRKWSKDKDGPEVVDVFLGCDRSAWAAAIEPDSATWTQILMPGGVASPAFNGLNIESTPLAVETDSAGAVVRRLTIR